MVTRLGQGAYLGIGQGAFGTNMINTDMQRWYRVTDAFDNLQLERDVIEFADLTDEFESLATVVAGNRRVTGSVTLVAPYDGMQDLMRLLTGHNVAVSGVGPFTYAFVPVYRTSGNHYVIAGSGREVCLEIFRGTDTDGTSPNSTFYQGCILQSIQLTFEPNGFVMITMNFIGRGFTQTAKSATPVFATQFIVTPTGQVQGTFPLLQLQGTTLTCFSATINIATGIDFRFDVTAIETLLPLPVGKQEIGLEVEIEVLDDAFLARLDDPAGARFTSGQLQIDTGVGAANRNLLFGFDELLLSSPSEPRAAGLGPVRTSLSLTARSSNPGVTPAYNVTVINNESDYVLS